MDRHRDTLHMWTQVGGVCIIPGDYAYADSSGAVVIPAGSVRQVLEEAVRIEGDDDRLAEQIRAEDPAQARRGAQTTAQTGPEHRVEFPERARDRIDAF